MAIAVAVMKMATLRAEEHLCRLQLLTHPLPEPCQRLVRREPRVPPNDKLCPIQVLSSGNESR